MHPKKMHQHDTRVCAERGFCRRISTPRKAGGRSLVRSDSRSRREGPDISRSIYVNKDAVRVTVRYSPDMLRFAEDVVQGSCRHCSRSVAWRTEHPSCREQVGSERAASQALAAARIHVVPKATIATRPRSLQSFCRELLSDAGAAGDTTNAQRAAAK